MGVECRRLFHCTGRGIERGAQVALAMPAVVGFLDVANPGRAFALTFWSPAAPTPALAPDPLEEAAGRREDDGRATRDGGANTYIGSVPSIRSG